MIYLIAFGNLISEPRDVEYVDYCFSRFQEKGWGVASKRINQENLDHWIEMQKPLDCAPRHRGRNESLLLSWEWHLIARLKGEPVILWPNGRWIRVCYFISMLILGDPSGAANTQTFLASDQLIRQLSHHAGLMPFASNWKRYLPRISSGYSLNEPHSDST